ncbi:MAG: tetratricopeptide repeat protein [Candidatus Pseudomonas colombiensis]|nr:MAG: tetratricopeptide repeat protein [Pseudomonas sp.]
MSWPSRATTRRRWLNTARAWELIPQPKENWEAATWVLAAIADALYLSGDLAAARDTLEHAMHCPDALGNPFLHLRLGQVLFDSGAPDQAADQLMRAYMGAGAAIFAEEDPRYLAFLGTRAQL